MKILFFANTDWYLYNFRLPLARAIRERGNEVVFVSPEGEYGPRLESEGFRWITLPMQRRSLNPFLELRLILALIFMYRKEAPDLVQHFTIKSVIYGTFAAQVARVGACVNAITGMGYIFSSNNTFAKLIRPIVKIILKKILEMRCSLLILQNPDDASLMVSENIVSFDKVRLIRGSGVNTDLFKPAPVVTRKGTEGFKVMLSTRLLWEKGVREYVSAARNLSSKSSISIEFHIAGKPDPGNPNSVTAEKIKEWEQEGIIKFLGHAERMSELLTEMDCIILPTYYGEGVPRILIEAAATGLPIIATDMPGCREIVKDGVNGFLVPVRNSQAIEESVKFLMENPEERKRMGRAGRELAVAEFDEKRVINETLSIYQELISC